MKFLPECIRITNWFNLNFKFKTIYFIQFWLHLSLSILTSIFSVPWFQGPVAMLYFDMFQPMHGFGKRRDLSHSVDYRQPVRSSLEELAKCHRLPNITICHMFKLCTHVCYVAVAVSASVSVIAAVIKEMVHCYPYKLTYG